MRAPLPGNERERLAALRRYDILDTAPEMVFDDLTLLATQICRVPIATFSLVDGDRQWFKSRVGLEVSQTEREAAFCAHTILDEHILEVADAMRDERFAENRLVLGDPHIRFYAGAPVRSSDGFNLGTICVIDRAPRERLDSGQRAALEALARQAGMLLELRRTSRDLAAVIRDVRALSDILPICGFCRRFRDEDNRWLTAEERLTATGARLSHGLCPDCLRKQYPEYADVLKPDAGAT